jgi:hypothetical protein
MRNFDTPTPGTRRALARALGFALILVLAATAAQAAKREPVFTLTDPRGDDHGEGALLYPDRPDFQPGDLDLVELSAWVKGEDTVFEATFANPVRVPERRAVDSTGEQLSSIARYGFYTLNLDIYIDTDRVPGSGAVGALPGRRVEISPEHAWDRAISLTPRPHEARGELSRMVLRSLSERMAAEDQGEEINRAELRATIPDELEDRVYFPNQVRVFGRKIQFQVPNRFLGGPAQSDWSYVVVVSGADVIQRVELGGLLGVGGDDNEQLMVLERLPGRQKDRFGGGREGDAYQPPVVDILVPPGVVQEQLLRSYDSAGRRPVQLIGVVPSSTEEVTLPSTEEADSELAELTTL